MYKKFKINIDIIHGNKSLENLQSIIKNLNYKKIIFKKVFNKKCGF